MRGLVLGGLQQPRGAPVGDQMAGRTVRLTHCVQAVSYYSLLNSFLYLPCADFYIASSELCRESRQQFRMQVSDCPISSPACLDQQKLPLESTVAPAGWQTSWSCTNGIASQVTHPASITGRITGLLVAAPSALRQTGSMESSTPACFCRTGRLAQHCT